MSGPAESKCAVVGGVFVVLVSVVNLVSQRWCVGIGLVCRLFIVTICGGASFVLLLLFILLTF